MNIWAVDLSTTCYLVTVWLPCVVARDGEKLKMKDDGELHSTRDVKSEMQMNWCDNRQDVLFTWIRWR